RLGDVAAVVHLRGVEDGSAGAHHREIIHHRHRLDVVGESWFRTKRRVRTTGQGFFFIAPSRRGGPESTTHETGDCFHHRAPVGPSTRIPAPRAAAIAGTMICRSSSPNSPPSPA